MTRSDRRDAAPERDGGATVCSASAGPYLWDRDGSRSELRHRLRLRSGPFSDDIISRDESVFVFANARRRVVGGVGVGVIEQRGGRICADYSQ